MHADARMRQREVTELDPDSGVGHGHRLGGRRFAHPAAKGSVGFGDRWPAGRHHRSSCRTCGCGQYRVEQALCPGSTREAFKSAARLDNIGWNVGRHERAKQLMEHADDDPVPRLSTCFGTPRELSVIAAKA
jgi:hypothetical protein